MGRGDESDVRPLCAQLSLTDSSPTIHRQGQSCQSSWAGRGEAEHRTHLGALDSSPAAQISFSLRFTLKHITVSGNPAITNILSIFLTAFKISACHQSMGIFLVYFQWMRSLSLLCDGHTDARLAAVHLSVPCLATSRGPAWSPHNQDILIPEIKVSSEWQQAERLKMQQLHT